jgi:signal peptidase
MAIAFVHRTHETHTSDFSAIEYALRMYRGVIAVFLASVAGITIVLAAFSIVAPKNSFGPKVLGHQLLVVRSGSMGPVFPTGSVVGIKSISATEANQIPEGTIVAFRSLANPNILITHRVISRLTPASAATATGPAQYVTKGDANAVEDGTILTASRIVGTYSFSVPRAGYALVAIQKGRLLVTFFIAFIFASIAVMLTHWAFEPTQTKENQ